MTAYTRLEDVPSDTYDVVYADPPWKFFCYSNPTTGARNAAAHYNVMDTDGIANMDVGRIAKKDAWLFMWITWPTLFEAERVIRAWGFRYSTCAFVWVKTKNSSESPRMGMGYLTRANTEACLVGRRGDAAGDVARRAPGHHGAGHAPLAKAKGAIRAH